MDINVNSICSLNCAKCTQGMPYIKDKKIYPSHEVIDNINDLLKNIDYIYQVGIIGGEPFINKDLDEVIDYCAENRQIGMTTVVTNGTIFPEEKILNSLKRKNVRLVISHYNLKNDKNRIALLKWAEKEKINYTYNEDQFWLDFVGDSLKKRNYSKHKLKKGFNNCVIKDCVAFKGRYLFRCPKEEFISDQLGMRYSECICIDEVSNWKKEIKKFYRRDFLSACRYCYMGDELKKCEPGTQATIWDIERMDKSIESIIKELH